MFNSRIRICRVQCFDKRSQYKRFLARVLAELYKRRCIFFFSFFSLARIINMNRPFRNLFGRAITRRILVRSQWLNGSLSRSSITNLCYSTISLSSSCYSKERSAGYGCSWSGDRRQIWAKDSSSTNRVFHTAGRTLVTIVPCLIYVIFLRL